jgi:PAS domain S-box-containing protein
MYGWSAEEAVGRHAGRFVTIDLSDEQRAEIRRETAERGCWHGEVTVRRRDASTISVEVSNVAVRDERGRTIG